MVCTRGYAPWYADKKLCIFIQYRIVPGPARKSHKEKLLTLEHNTKAGYPWQWSCGAQLVYINIYAWENTNACYNFPVLQTIVMNIHPLHHSHTHSHIPFPVSHHAAVTPLLSLYVYKFTWALLLCTCGTGGITAVLTPTTGAAVIALLDTTLSSCTTCTNTWTRATFKQ